MKEEIFTKTYELIDEIKDQSEYKRLLKLKEIIKSDPVTSLLIQEFKKSKEQYQEVSKYGKYHPDLKDVQQSFSEKKGELYSNPLIKEYKECEKAIDRILKTVAKELAESVSKKIKYPNTMGLIEKSR